MSLGGRVARGAGWPGWSVFLVSVYVPGDQHGLFVDAGPLCWSEPHDMIFEIVPSCFGW